MTYNKDDYKQEELENFGVKVKIPVEALQEFGVDLREVETRFKRKGGFLKLISKIKGFAKGK